MLIKAVLEATPVYWTSLAWIPRGILNRIQNLCSRFLWKGNQPGRIFAWARWDLLCIPKKWGGWGTKKLEDLSTALAAKLGWHPLTSTSLWTKIAAAKYIAPLRPLEWLRQPSWNKSGISNIWKAVLNALPLIRDGLTWRIYDGASVQIGRDPWIGCGNAHQLPLDLLQILIEKGIMHINHAADPEQSSFLHQAWKTARSLLLPRQWHQSWHTYTSALQESHIRLREGEDEIIWAIAKSGRYSLKEGYLLLANNHKPQLIKSWWKDMWKRKAPPRTRLLLWSILKNKVPISENLIKRGQHGPYWCCFFKNNSEYLDHLFLSCLVTIDLWTSTLTTFTCLLSGGDRLPRKLGQIGGHLLHRPRLETSPFSSIGKSG